MIGFYFRNSLGETPAFEAMNEAIDEGNQRTSLKEIFVEHRKALLICTAIVIFYNVRIQVK
ncbi:hypothetical protein J2S21_002898 [Peribacillus cavernae]|nr:hypothetical protein [Peribacillus cavernae]